MNKAVYLFCLSSDIQRTLNRATFMHENQTSQLACFISLFLYAQVVIYCINHSDMVYRLTDCLAQLDLSGCKTSITEYHRELKRSLAICIKQCSIWYLSVSLLVGAFYFDCAFSLYMSFVYCWDKCNINASLWLDDCFLACIWSKQPVMTNFSFFFSFFLSLSLSLCQIASATPEHFITLTILKAINKITFSVSAAI